MVKPSYFRSDYISDSFCQSMSLFLSEYCPIHPFWLSSGWGTGIFKTSLLLMHTPRTPHQKIWKSRQLAKEHRTSISSKLPHLGLLIPLCAARSLVARQTMPWYLFLNTCVFQHMKYLRTTAFLKCLNFKKEGK